MAADERVFLCFQSPKSFFSLATDAGGRKRGGGEKPFGDISIQSQPGMEEEEEEEKVVATRERERERERRRWLVPMDEGKKKDGGGWKEWKREERSFHA